MSSAILTATRSADSLTEVPREMGIAGGGIELAVTEQRVGDRQLLAERKRRRSEGATKAGDHESLAAPVQELLDGL